MIKGMVLAAGMGTRLRPLVGEFPKPLAPILNRPMILFNLLLLKEAGITDIIVNLHYHGSQIARSLGDGSRWGLNLSYSEETDLLGTGGGIRKARKFFNENTFVVANGDTIADLNLKQAIGLHQKRQADATMMLMPDPRAEAFGAVRMDSSLNGQIQSIAGVPDSPLPDPSLQGMVFAGIHIMEPRVLDLVPEMGQSCIVRTAYKSMLQRDKEWAVHGDPSCRFWCDAGTPERYLQANLTLLARPDWCTHMERESHRDVTVAPHSAEATILSPSIIGKDCTIEPGATVGPMAILGDGVKVKSGCTVRRSVVWTNCVVESNLLDQVQVR